MPRPRMRKETVVVSVAIERDLALRLKEEARRKGLSVSQLVESILSEALGRASESEVVEEAAAEPAPPVVEEEGSEEEETVEVVKPPPPPPSPPWLFGPTVDWGFCPSCLSIYAYEGYAECPKCGMDLVSMRTEEGKRMYQQIKAERRKKGEL